MAILMMIIISYIMVTLLLTAFSAQKEYTLKGRVIIYYHYGSNHSGVHLRTFYDSNQQNVIIIDSYLRKPKEEHDNDIEEIEVAKVYCYCSEVLFVEPITQRRPYT